MGGSDLLKVDSMIYVLLIYFIGCLFNIWQIEFTQSLVVLSSLVVREAFIARIAHPIMLYLEHFPCFKLK